MPIIGINQDKHVVLLHMTLSNADGRPAKTLDYLVHAIAIYLVESHLFSNKAY